MPTLLEDLSRSFAPEEILAKHLEQPPVAPPGAEVVAAAPAGYIVAGLLLERVLDQDLAAIIEERFTGPLALDDTLLTDGSVRPTRHGWLSLPPADADPNRPFDLLDGPHEALMTTHWAAEGMISSPPTCWRGAVLRGRPRRGNDRHAARNEPRPAPSTGRPLLRPLPHRLLHGTGLRPQ